MSMEPCCALKYFPELDVCQSEKDGDMDAKKKAMEQAEEEDFGSTKFGKWRSWMWNTIEYPWTSKLAQVGKNVLCIFNCQIVFLHYTFFNSNIRSTRDISTSYQ